MIIYKATCLINNKIYIGQTVDSLQGRRRSHNKANNTTIFWKAIKKYGKENFVWEVIEYCYSIDEMNYLEKYYISYYGSIAPNGYNLHTGGNNHVTLLSTKLKIGAANKGKRMSPATEIKPKQRLSPATEFKKGHVATNKKQVINLESGIVYNSITEAALCHGIKMKTLSYQVNRGVYSKFKFVEDANG